MGRTSTTTFQAHGGGKSLCYRCRHWDWAIAFESGRASGEWEHVCLSPIEFLKPGDRVEVCEGFEEVRPPGAPA